jgi:excisionase family DNA binding protein
MSSYADDEQGSTLPPTDVMTLSEVASYLKVAERTVLRMVHGGEIPCAKVGGQWRFLRTVVDDWLLSRMSLTPSGEMAAPPVDRGTEADRGTEEAAQLGRPATGEAPLPPAAASTDTAPPPSPAATSPPSPALRFSRFAHEDRVLLGLDGRLSKQEVLEKLARPLADGGVVTDHAAFVKRLLEREHLLSTAVVPHVALPHIRKPDPGLVRGAGVSIGISPRGIDFDSLDGEPTKLFVMLAAESEDVHLGLLAQAGAILRSSETVEALVSAAHPHAVLRVLIEADYKLLLSAR